MSKFLIKSACCVLLFLTCEPSDAQERVQPFRLSQVRLTESPFLKAQQTDARYILSLDEDRLLAPFLKDAGIAPLAPNYGNWESQGLDGHIAGHYLSAVAQLYAATGDTIYYNRLKYMLGWLEKCQQRNGNGYVGGVPGGKVLWQEIGNGNVGLIWSRWVPWYNLHKLYSGLVDTWLLTGDEQAKRILLALSQWAYELCSRLNDLQMQQMLGAEHGGMNEVFANVADISGDPRYMELARRFSHQALLQPLLHRQDSLTGLHANTQIPKVIGFMRVAQLTGDTSWANAAQFFWNTVVRHRSVVFGGNSVREHFNAIDDFSGMLESREGPETCNSYNMLKLTKALFLSRASGSYIDYYERTLYNHILSSQDPNGGFVYFTPIRPDHYRVYSTPQQCFWCCVGSGMENHGKYGELIYAHNGDDLYVNLFIPSVLNWTERSMKVVQQTAFPFAEKSTLSLSIKQPGRFVVRIRRPSWINGAMHLTVNGEPVAAPVGPDGYVAIERTWQDKDEIVIRLPMTTHAEQLPDGSSWLAFLHGPIVLAARTTTGDLKGLWADSSRWGHIAGGRLSPMDTTPMLMIDSSQVAALVQGSASPGITPEETDSSRLTFSLRASLPRAAANLELAPFFALHESRYIVYWPYASRADMSRIAAAMKGATQAREQRDAATLDIVYPGEQQPEADHHWKGENSVTGFFRERHYRGGKGWFSYELRNDKPGARQISFTYYGGDGGKKFQVWVDGRKKADVITVSDGKHAFKDYILDLPTGLPPGKPLTVEFRAEQASEIPGIYEVRLLRKMRR